MKQMDKILISSLLKLVQMLEKLSLVYGLF